SVTVLCQFVVTPRGPEPPAPAVPTGPNIQETSGKAAPAPTFEDLLKSDHDEKLFEYFFTSQLAAVDTATGKKTPIGRPALLDANRLSPNNEYILVTKIERPFSRLVTMNGFPKTVEIWNRKGEAVKKIASVPSSEGIPINGVITGPRGYRWRPDQPATVIW